MKQLPILISLAAICITSYGLFRVVMINRKIPGGIVKQYWRLLYYLIGLLIVGFLATLLFPSLPEPSKKLITAIIALSASIFIIKVINLFYKIMKDIGL